MKLFIFLLLIVSVTSTASAGVSCRGSILYANLEKSYSLQVTKISGDTLLLSKTVKDVEFLASQDKKSGILRMAIGTKSTSASVILLKAKGEIDLDASDIPMGSDLIRGMNLKCNVF